MNRREFSKSLLYGAIGSVISSNLKCKSILTQNSSVIAEENKYSGTKEWVLNNTKLDSEEKYRCPWIEGYCSHQSILAGEKLQIFVKTNPVSDFHIDFYRMGYYQGNGARHLLSTGPIKGIQQKEPEKDKNGYMECQWKVSYEIKIPEDWLSGVYLGKLTNEKNSIQSYIIFIVRDSRPVDFLFQCSDLTWISYNEWPAKSSLYDYEDKRWYLGNLSSASFNRPYGLYRQGKPSPLTIGSAEFLLWEFPLLFWMEKMGYNLSYCSNMDTHFGNILNNTKSFISVGHDEYYSAEMVSNLDGAIKRGMHAVFLSGNSVGGKISLLANQTGDMNKVIRRDNLFENEKDLMGTTSYGMGWADWNCKNTKHWIYHGTGLKENELIQNLVGWEYHGRPFKENTDNFTILASSPIDKEALSFDHWNFDETARHDAIYMEGLKDNFVFNAGTCYWSLALSSPPMIYRPDFSPKEDSRVQKMTQNIFDKIRS